MPSESPVTIARIYLTEADSNDHTQLAKEVLKSLHDDHMVRGATLFRGIAGFGQTGEIHEAGDLLRIMVDLPLVIEFFDSADKVEAVMKALSDKIPAGRIVCWQANCH
jgi:PII-like signaling protein